MAKKKQARKVVRLLSTVSKSVYYTTEDKMNGVLELNKYDPAVRRVVLFKQIKKKNLGRNEVKARKN